MRTTIQFMDKVMTVIASAAFAALVWFIIDISQNV